MAPTTNGDGAAVAGDALDGRVVVVTGAGGGLGRALVTAFTRRGAHVVAVDVDGDAATAVAADLAASGGGASAAACDVSASGQVGELIDGTLARLGRIDVLVNNAGVTSAAPITELSEHEWDRVLDVNAKGTFLCCRAVLPSMLARREGTIVNVASQAGLRGNPFLAHYCAAKAAVVNFTRALALEAAPYVRANCICPGTVETPMLRASFEREAALHGVGLEQFEAARLREIPLGRYQDVDAVADGALFLATTASRDITGEVLSISGGMVMS